MSPLALLLALALAAPLRAASLPASHVLPPIPAKQDDIPVKVVLDDVELEPTNHNEVDNEEIQRPAVDLRNPGPPQRQEHETQNPEQHSDELLKVSSIRESIERTRDMLAQSLKETSASVQTWLTNSDDQSNIQKSIQSLRDTFTNQIQKLNNTIHDLIKPEEAMPEESERKIDVIDSKLKSLKDSFNNGLETLSAGVELAAMLKLSPEDEAEGKQEAESSSVAPAEASNPTSPASTVNQFFQDLGQNLSNQFNSIMSVFQRPPAAASPAGAQADTPSETPSQGFRPPGIIAGWITNLSQTFPNWTQNFQNIPNPIQGLQGIQQGLISINPFRPATTAKPAEATSSGSSEPVKTDPSSEAQKPSADKPVEVEKPAEASTQPGPIRQFLNSIPVVQRIQSSLGNRDTPRQPAAAAPVAAPAAAAPAPAAPVPAPVIAEASAQTKGGWYGGPRPGASGDSNDSNRLSERSEEVKAKEPIKEEVKEPIKEEMKQPIKVEMKETLKEEMKQPINEEMKQPIKEEMKQPIKEEMKQTIKEEMKQPIKEEMKESLKDEIKKDAEETKPEPVADKTE